MKTSIIPIYTAKSLFILGIFWGSMGVIMQANATESSYVNCTQPSATASEWACPRSTGVDSTIFTGKVLYGNPMDIVAGCLLDKNSTGQVATLTSWERIGDHCHWSNCPYKIDNSHSSCGASASNPNGCTWTVTQINCTAEPSS